AFRARLRDRDELAAMVAFEPMTKSVLDEPGRAIRALELEAAVAAHRNRRVATAIEKQKRLLAARQRLGHGIDKHRRQPLAALGRVCAHVDGGDARKARSLVAPGKLDVLVAALFGIHQAFDRGRGGAQDHRAMAERSAHHRHVARLVGDALLLLVALVVLLIDDDQAEIGEGEEQGRAGSDHELGVILCHGPPHAAAHRRRHAGITLRRARAEALLATGTQPAGGAPKRSSQRAINWLVSAISGISTRTCFSRASAAATASKKTPVLAEAVTAEHKTMGK